MAGLVPAIHAFLLYARKQDVDARHKAGHDEKLDYPARISRIASSFSNR